MNPQEGSKKSPVKRRVISSTGLFSKAVAVATNTGTARPSTSSRFSTRGHGSSASGQERPSTADAIKQSSAIVCRDVPDEENNCENMKNHFRRFGVVIRLTCQISKQQCIVHFKTHEEAEKAKLHGSVFQNSGKRMKIFWRQPTPKTRRKSKSDVELELEAMSGTSDTKQKLDFATKKSPDKPKQRLRKKSVGPKSDVELELEAMSGTSDTKRELSFVAQKLTDKPKRPLKKSLRPKKEFKPDPALLKILKTPANSVSQRFEVLNARDRLVRASKMSKPNLSTSKVLCGTCQDMCPEKERYARQEKKQLSIFELHPSSEPGNHVVDHALAIKEYSRSSADQEEPLPFELRPTPTLCMTMDYLTCNIMDILETQANVTSSDWFDFLWNRTRAIRKDVTQQHLCNLQVVALIEKCARFHIYCSERLCEEDMMTFDPKINNENLTKCMQTLKHFYYDLGIKNIKCPFEAEFRSYDILLNLSRGEILREVQQLSPEVRKHAFVCFALNVLTAFNSNNFTRFFKLVKRGTFLHACILHRYFAEIRTKALQTIVKAYCPSHHSIQFPIVDIVHSLGFESDSEAVSFCQAHGLNCPESTVTLSRDSFYHPESAVAIGRARNIIESKMNSSVGEIVNGLPLPQNPKSYYVPHDSFDANGLLKLEDICLELDERPQEVRDAPVAAQTARPAPKQMPAVENREEKMEIIAEVSIDLLKDTIDEVLGDVSRREILFFHFLTEQSEGIFDDLMLHFVREVCSRELLEANLRLQKQKETEEKLKVEMELRTKLISNRVSDELLDRVIDKQIRAISSAQIRYAEEEEEKRERLHRCVTELKEEILKSVADEMIEEISGTIYDERVVAVREKLDAISKRIGTKLVKKYFKIWLHKHVLHSRLKNATNTFPSGPSSLSTENKLRILGPERKVTSIDELAAAENQNARLLDVACIGTILNTEQQWMPLNLPSIVQNAVADRFADVLPGDFCFWKLCLSFPDDGRCDWLERKFTRGTTKRHPRLPQVRNLSLYSTEMSASNGAFRKIGICVNSATGIVDLRDDCAPNGTLALLVGAAFSDTKPTEVVLRDCFRRMECLLVNKPRKPALPVAVLAVGDRIPSFDEFHHALNVGDFKASGLISDLKVYKMAEGFHFPSSAQTLINAVKWLAEKCPQIPKITSCSIAEFIETHVVGRAVRQICEDKHERSKFGVLQQDPNHTVDLINHCVSHMKSIDNVGCDPDLSWPPSEFSKRHDVLPPKNWSGESLDEFLEMLDMFLFDGFPELSSWNEAVEYIWRYVDSHKRHGIDNTDLIARVDYLLERIRRLFRERCLIDYGIEDCEPTVDDIPWTDIILSITDYMIVALYRITENSPHVYFIEKRLKPPSVPSSWLNASHVLNRNTSLRQEESILESVSKRKLEESVDENSQTKLKLLKTDLQHEADRLTKNIHRKLLVERQQMKEFESRLLEAEGDSKIQVSNTTRSMIEDCDLSIDLNAYSLENKFEAIQLMLNQSLTSSYKFDRSLNTSLES